MGEHELESRFLGTGASPLYFHELRIHSMHEYTRWKSPVLRPNFDPRECGERARTGSCVPRYIEAWQSRIRAALPPLFSTARGWGSCAVVGSSARILGSAQGATIDAADAVVRVNEAPTGRWAEDVGNRTTLRVIGTQPLPRRPPADGSALVVACPGTPWMGQCWLTLDGSETPPWPRVAPYLWRALREHMRRIAGRDLGGGAAKQMMKAPTTGAIAILLSLRSCRSVSLFGFGNGSWGCNQAGVKASRTRGKYYTQTPLKKYLSRTAHYHDLETEWKWIDFLVRTGRVSPHC